MNQGVENCPKNNLALLCLKSVNAKDSYVNTALYSVKRPHPYYRMGHKVLLLLLFGYTGTQYISVEGSLRTSFNIYSPAGHTQELE